MEGEQPNHSPYCDACSWNRLRVIVGHAHELSMTNNRHGLADSLTCMTESRFREISTLL